MTAEKTVIETIDLLETRLRRVEFYLSGDNIPETLKHTVVQGKNGTVYSRLERLNRALEKLSSRSQAVSEILNLHRQHPEIFPSPSIDNGHTSLSTTELLSIISSCATLYPITASRLTAIQDLPIPSAETSTSLISLDPRLARVEVLQESQSRELADLRIRTASCVQRWYDLGVLGGGECWTDWEGRMGTVEKTVRREETTKARDSITT